LSGTVSIENDEVVLELHGVDEFLSIKRTMRIPLNKIISVSTEDVPWDVFKTMKIAGTDLPGHVKDGRFWSKDGMMFYEMHHPDKCITINLDHNRYKKIIFEVEDKESAAAMIRDAMSSEQLTHSNDEFVSELGGK
jgi:hypothetical protein